MTREARRDYEADVLDALKKAQEAMCEALESADRLGEMEDGVPSESHQWVAKAYAAVNRCVSDWTPVAATGDDTRGDL